MEKLNQLIDTLDKYLPEPAKALVFPFFFICLFLVLFGGVGLIRSIILLAIQVFILYWNKRSDNQLYKAMKSKWRKIKKRL